MTNTRKSSSRYLWAAFAALLAFCIGYVHHRWFYPIEFHGDSAAMHVLAEAILTQGSLLPDDFSYGNQLVILRSSPFIALALAFGLVGPSAFIFGSSLSIAFWGLILSIFLSTYFKSIPKGIFFAMLLLLPFGNWDSDYVLGQQSHLSNAILALGTAVSMMVYIEKKNRLSIVIASVCLFLLSVEAPIRGLLVLAPLVVSLLFTIGRRRAIAISPPLGAAFVLAYLLNKFLVRSHPIYNNFFNTLSFKSVEQILGNFGKTSQETLGSISSINAIAGDKISVAGFLVLGAGLLVVAMYLAFFAYWMRRVVGLGAAKVTDPLQLNAGVHENKDGVIFVQMVAVFGLVFGALAVAALNPDSSRHYLWAIFLAKFFVLKYVFEFLSSRAGRRNAAIMSVILAFLMSSWFAYLVKFHWHTNDVIESRNFTEAIKSIDEISKKTGIKNIYGDDFWRMMPLNTLISDINSQALLLDGRDIRPFSLLTMPHWACAKGDVLYYLKGGAVDDAIKQKLIESGGVQLKSGSGYSLWRGGRVWMLPLNSGCFESTLQYKGSSFAKLPAAVGVVDGDKRKANGVAGFLVYGPYISLQAGEYELSVYGSADALNGAYVDVVSNSGSVVHGRFDFKQLNKESLLLRVPVNLTSTVKDLEIRVWVTEKDALELTGYSLNLMSKKR